MGDITQQAQQYELQQQQVVASQPTNLGHEKLLTALYAFWDGFDRANMQMFGIKDTGKQIKEQKLLAGDHLDLGVRKLEWLSGSKHIFDSYASEYYKFVKEDENGIEYKFNDVPVRIKFYDDNPYVTQCDSVVYENETFNLPNPYDLFQQEYE